MERTKYKKLQHIKARLCEKKNIQVSKCVYIYISIQKESRPARLQTLNKSKHMGMSQTEVSVFPLK